MQKECLGKNINGLGVEPSGRAWFYERHGIEDVPVPGTRSITSEPLVARNGIDQKEVNGAARPEWSHQDFIDNMNT